MPKQHVFFGRPLPPLNSRRIPCLLASLAIFALLSLVYIAPSAVPAGPSLSIADHKFSIPKSVKSKWNNINPFKPPSHAPPHQKNDTYGEMTWYSNWKWLTIPFSSSVTLDENRSLLPEMVERQPIYCYYDTTIEKDEESQKAESRLLLTWRKAWWAQGFKPIILSAAEAMNNPLYEELQRKDFDPGLKTDIMRWLAWENMGGGLLAHYLLFPMGPHDDPLLAFFRRGEFPRLTRWKGLGDGLFVGPKAQVGSAIRLAMDTANAKLAKDFLSAVPTTDKGDGEDPFTVDDTPASLALYDAAAVEKKYAKVADAFGTSRAAGLDTLNQLVTAHLHNTWQEIFSDGIAVLKPLPKVMTTVVEPAFELAQRLAHCPKSPIPVSCPPNRPKCSPCLPAHPLKVSTPAVYQNTTKLFTIGTVPHPYTLAALTKQSDNIDIRWIRRKAPRDPWVKAVTKRLLGTGVSTVPRVLSLKQAIASEPSASRSLWFSAERDPPIPDDVDWRFGFAIPAYGEWADDGKSETPVPGPERRPPQPPPDPADGPAPTPEDLARERPLLQRARAFGKSRDRADVVIRNAIEAWNLADTEAWRFARAYLARARVERLKWEEEESRYAGGAGTEKDRRSGWGRWLDSKKED
ncbi:hypothetical protein VTK73DRAFT_1175 [Phialemonium thermophilum]|uniref:Uncharacterized protein n=1 Tax=Phialemonium thermophilum TaxID=223376 RepID=A0ABR3XAU7_9PEZI